jgi:hypothetical protein
MCVFKILVEGYSTNLEERFFVLFVCIVVGQIGTYVKFFLLLNNLSTNYKTICLCFSHQFLLNYLVLIGCLAFVGCLVFFASTCFVIQ